MSGRKRTKRKNSDDDFDVDEGDDGFELNDINTWACHSCTFVNRAAAFRCSMCGTRKGTSTRRSRCNDNVVEMQKSITDMVQKQVEKEKSLKRKERSMVKSVTRDEEETLTEVKTEKLDEQPKMEIMEDTPSVETVATATPNKIPLIQKSETIPSPTPKKVVKSDDVMKLISGTRSPEEESIHEIKKTLPKFSRDSTPYSNGVTTPSTIEVTMKKPVSVEKIVEKEATPIPIIVPPATCVSDLPLPSSSYFANVGPEVKIEVTPNPRPAVVYQSIPSTSTYIAQHPVPYIPEMIPNIVPVTPTKPVESFLNQLPERVVKKLNHQLPFDIEVLRAHKRITGRDPIIADTEAVLLPNDWDKQKVMKVLASSLGHHTISPTTSRQSSETDSSSSDGNRSFETPLSDAHPSVSKCCQIPDYMIHREAPRKIFIVANGYPAFFEEFPRRI